MMNKHQSRACTRTHLGLDPCQILVTRTIVTALSGRRLAQDQIEDGPCLPTRISRSDAQHLAHSSAFR